MSGFTNPPFEILSIEQHSGLTDFGDDSIHWWIQVKTKDYVVPVSVWFDMVVEYCKLQHPEVGAYYRSVRSNVKGFGPKHSKMFAIMAEEGFDHMPHIYNYIKDCCNLEHYHQHDLKMKEYKATPEGAQKLEEKVTSMEEGMPDMRSSTIRNIAFMDHLLEVLTAEVLERYPEIFNSDPKYIKECERVLTDTIRDLSQKVDSLAHHAKNDK